MRPQLGLWPQRLEGQIPDVYNREYGWLAQPLCALVVGGVFPWDSSSLRESQEEQEVPPAGHRGSRYVQMWMCPPLHPKSTMLSA